MLVWNMRGINYEKNQKYLDWVISDQQPDVVIFKDIKLASILCRTKRQEIVSNDRLMPYLTRCISRTCSTLEWLFRSLAKKKTTIFDAGY